MTGSQAGDIVRRATRRAAREVKSLSPSREIRGLFAKYDIAGHRRVYLVHIRKTAGTSLNNMFLSLGGGDGSSTFDALTRDPIHQVVIGERVFVGWNRRLINRGDYFYAFSHIPYHELQLPPDTFTITTLRDPVARVVSHYRMLCHFRDARIDHPCMRTEGPWLGSSFDDFLARMPRQHLLNQLFMFSKSMDPVEAIDRIAELTHVMFTERFDEGVDRLVQRARLPLEAMHVRRSTNEISLTNSAEDRLREILRPEIDVYSSLFSAWT